MTYPQNNAMSQMRSESLSLRWSRAVAVLILIAVGWGVLSRCRPPSGDKYLDYFGPGGHDFRPVYYAAESWWGGLDPMSGWRDPLNPQPFNVNNRVSWQYYPPTNYLLLAPLVWIYGEDRDSATSALFYLNFVLLAVLAELARQVFLGAWGAGPSPGWIGHRWFWLTVLWLSFPARFGLERGNIDILQAVFFWSAVHCLIRRRAVVACLLALAGTLMKGYGLVFFPGIALLAVARSEKPRQLLAVTAAGALALIGPVLALLPEAARAIRARLNVPLSTSWQNDSWFNLARLLRVPRPDAFAAVCLGVWLVLALAFLASAWRETRPGSRTRLASLLPFSVLALSAVFLADPVSYIYNLLLIFPGLLAILLGAGRAALPLTARQIHLAGAATAEAAILIFWPRVTTPTFPSATVGMGIVAALVAYLAVLARLSGRRRAAAGRGAAKMRLEALAAAV
jgi:hypothetical protein